MIDVRAIGHATIDTPDVDRQIEYYTQILGLHVEHRDARHAVLVTVTGRPAVVLHKGESARCTRIALQVGAGTALSEVAAKLQAGEGINSELRRDASPGIAETLVLQDPIGTTIELYREAKLARKREPNAIAPMKLGHIAFSCSDVKHQTEFYCRVLGFRVSDWMEDVFAFLRCGPDHHTVNFAAFGGRSGAGADATAKSAKLHHVAFELKDWAHMQAACDLLGRRNLQILWGPGRHGIGHNIFIYHRNPDDQIIECYTELDMMLDEGLGTFDPKPWHKDNPQVPKVWKKADAALTWGPPPHPDYFRGKD